MANALVHEITIDDSQTVETAFQLREALDSFTDHLYGDLDATYVIERLDERLSDGSIARSIRIRLAERI